MKTVLVVEDDPVMQENFARMLTSIDPAIIVDRVPTGEEARDILDHANPMDYDLVIADQFLDGNETGLELWRHCQARVPDLPFLITSGTNLPAAISRAGPHHPTFAFLQKPFSLPHARYMMRVLLNRRWLLFPEEPETLVHISQKWPSSENAWAAGLTALNIALIALSLNAFRKQPLDIKEILNGLPTIEQQAPNENPMKKPFQKNEEWDKNPIEIWKVS